MDLANQSYLLFVCGIGVASCAGTRPHEMSADGHGAAARADMEAAEEHDHPEDLTQECMDGILIAGECTETDNQHAAEAARHRDLAGQHLAAEETLRTKEKSACRGIPAASNHTLLGEPASLTRVVVEGEGEDTVVTIHLAAGVPGEEELRQLVECHRARAAVDGPERSGVEVDPIGTHGVTVTVTAGGSGPLLRLTPSGRAVGRRLTERGAALATRVDAARARDEK